jgi:hypothetical protein
MVALSLVGLPRSRPSFSPVLPTPGVAPDVHEQRRPPTRRAHDERASMKIATPLVIFLIMFLVSFSDGKRFGVDDARSAALYSLLQTATSSWCLLLR